MDLIGTGIYPYIKRQSWLVRSRARCVAGYKGIPENIRAIMCAPSRFGPRN